MHFSHQTEHYRLIFNFQFSSTECQPMGKYRKTPNGDKIFNKKLHTT